MNISLFSKLVSILKAALCLPDGLRNSLAQEPWLNDIRRQERSPTNSAQILNC